MIRPSLRALAAAMVLAGLGTGCSEPQPQQCQRYDALSLTRENNFSARLDWKNPRMVDTSFERLEVALTVIRPIRGTIELVHLVGDTEADRWVLQVPDYNNSPTSLCSITPSGTPASCGAVLTNLPLSPGGHYYLLHGENRVLEAGLAFFLCD